MRKRKEKELLSETQLRALSEWYRDSAKQSVEVRKQLDGERARAEQQQARGGDQ